MLAVPSGGFRPQAQVASEAVRVINQAKALQDSGCFAIVLECIPAPIAAAVTEALSIPTIGIGAGPQCSGQVRAAVGELCCSLDVAQTIRVGLAKNAAF